MLQQSVLPPAKAGGSVSPPARRWLTRVGLPGALIIAFAALLARASWDSLRPALAVQTVPAAVRPSHELGAAVQAADEVVAQAPGWIEPAPYPFAVSALADGVVAELLVLDGDTVSAGQVVARLVADDAELALRAAEAQLAEQQAARSSARAQLANAQLRWAHPVEVERAVATAEAGLAAARAELQRLPNEEAHSRARLRELELESAQLTRVGDAWVPGFELEAAGYRVEGEAARLAGIIARRPMLNAEVRGLEAELQAARRNHELRFAERLERDLAEAQLQQAEARVARAEVSRDEAALRLERMQVKSAQPGIVLRRLAAPGSKLMLAMDEAHSAHVLHLYTPDSLQVRVDVPLADAARVGLGQRVEILCEVLPDHVFAGRVLRRVQLADLVKNTVELQVSVEAAAGLLTPDMLCRVKFFGRGSAETDSAPEDSSAGLSVFVPGSLIDDGSVWVLDPSDGVARRRSVKLGAHRLHGWIEVREGVFPGEHVIDPRRVTLSDGERVRVVGEVDLQENNQSRGGRF